MNSGKTKNTWGAKLKRTLTCLLPVSKDRKGECANCGKCCKLPNVCPLLKYRENGESYCSVHKFRPLNCRKYPRTSKEQIIINGCGYKFER